MWCNFGLFDEATEKCHTFGERAMLCTTPANFAKMRMDKIPTLSELLPQTRIESSTKYEGPYPYILPHLPKPEDFGYLYRGDIKEKFVLSSDPRTEIMRGLVHET